MERNGQSKTTDPAGRLVSYSLSQAPYLEPQSANSETQGPLIIITNLFRQIIDQNTTQQFKPSRNQNGNAESTATARTEKLCGDT